MKTNGLKLPFNRGQGLIEFSFVLPIMLLLVVGITEFGFYFMTSHTLQNASREGARLAVVLPNLIENDPRVTNHVENLIPDGGLFADFEDDITNNGIDIDHCDVNDQVTVTISGTYHFILMSIIGVNDIDISFPTTFRYELC